MASIAAQRAPEYRTPERTIIDGVPVFWLPSSGPLRAELLFRTGLVDESLPTRGITHLVEHLALGPILDRPAWWRGNATVEPYVTRFWMSGSPRDVTDTLARLTASLADLPTERLEIERSVLMTEEAGATFGSAKNISSRRWGARGIGLEDYREFGLPWLDAERVRAWAMERFNAGNAAVWLSGEVPDDLGLHLVAGKRFPRPTLEPLDVRTPALYQLGGNGVALSMLVPSGTTAYAAAAIVETRLRQRLRIEEGIAYHTSARARISGMPRRAALVLAADPLRANARKAAEVLIEIVRDLATDGYRTDELELVLALAKAAREDSPDDCESLGDAAQFEIGAVSGIISWERYDTEIAALTADQLAGYFEEALPTAILAVPDGISCEIEGFAPISDANGLTISGHRVTAAENAGHGDCIDYSEAGISWVNPDGTAMGMRWEDVAAAPWWNNGVIALIAYDGTALLIAPDRWKEPEPLLEAVRRHVPADRWAPADRLA